jgi:hypothetical protein
LTRLNFAGFSRWRLCQTPTASDSGTTVALVGARRNRKAEVHHPYPHGHDTNSGYSHRRSAPARSHDRGRATQVKPTGAGNRLAFGANVNMDAATTVLFLGTDLVGFVLVGYKRAG